MITSNRERASPCSHRSTPCSQHCCLELELLIESLKGLTTRELELLISMWGTRLPTCWQGSTSCSGLLLAAPLHCSTTAQTRRKLSQEAPSFMVQLGSPRAVTGRTQSDWRGGFSAKRALNCTLHYGLSNVIIRDKKFAKVCKSKTLLLAHFWTKRAQFFLKR